MSPTNDHPIIFSAPMIRAILAGCKTQTRRIRKDAHGILSPYGMPGDSLWVRETFAAPHACDHLPPRLIPADTRIHYAATEDRGGLLWRPSIHMPRHTSRIALVITDVRPEPLAAITDADAHAEGMDYFAANRASDTTAAPVPASADLLAGSPRHTFACLWDTLHGSGAWLENPPVWVVTFRLAGVRPE